MDFNSNISQNISLDIRRYVLYYRRLESCYLTWYLPLTILVGLFGNIASLVFLIISKMFPKNVLIWMVCICIGDMMTLGTDATRMLLKVWFKFDLRDMNDFMCKMHYFLTQYSVYWSSYMQACMSIQRLVLMLQPLRARSIFTTKRVISQCTFVSILVIFPLLPYFLYWNINTKSGDCEPDHLEMYATITILDIVLWGFIPLMTMTSSTIGISWSVFKASSERKALARQTAANKVARGDQRSKVNYRDDAWHVTRLLICMNVLYLVSAYPLLIYQIYLNAGGNKVNKTIPQQLHKTIYYFLRSICYLSCSWNWVFYCLGGRKFRERAVQIIRKTCCSKHQMMNMETQTKLTGSCNL